MDLHTCHWKIPLNSESELFAVNTSEVYRLTVKLVSTLFSREKKKKKDIFQVRPKLENAYPPEILISRITREVHSPCLALSNKGKIDEGAETIAFNGWKDTASPTDAWSSKLPQLLQFIFFCIISMDFKQMLILNARRKMAFRNNIKAEFFKLPQ